MTSGYATPPEVVEQIKALAAQGLGLSAIARQLDRPKSTVHRVMTRTGAAKPRPKRVAMVHRKGTQQTLNKDAPVDASKATITRIALPTEYGRVCNAAQRAPYVPRELNYRGRA